MQHCLHQPSAFSDDTPLARCYHLHALPLLAYVRQHVPSREDAEDIVIEAFIAAFVEFLHVVLVFRPRLAFSYFDVGRWMFDVLPSISRPANRILLPRP